MVEAWHEIRCNEIMQYTFWGYREKYRTKTAVKVNRTLGLLLCVSVLVYCMTMWVSECLWV